MEIGQLRGILVWSVLREDRLAVKTSLTAIVAPECTNQVSFPSSHLVHAETSHFHSAKMRSCLKITNQSKPSLIGSLSSPNSLPSCSMTIQCYSKTQCLDLFCNMCRRQKHLHVMISKNEELCKSQGLTLLLNFMSTLCVLLF